MPGSKRRALKNLLSPHHSPANSGNTPSGAPLQPVESGASLASISSAQSGASIASDRGNYMSDGQLENELELEQMRQREHTIGTTGGLPPAETAPPPPPKGQIEQQGAIGGAAMLDSQTGDNGGGGKKKSSKQKFEERQARKKEALLNSAPPQNPEWDAQLEKERQDEIRVITDACTVLGREIYEIAPDGHCMFHAIGHQLALLGVIPSNHSDQPSYTRKAAAQYMLAHPDEFRFFLPSVGGEDAEGATDHEGVMTEQEYAKYCHNIETTGEWGGEPEIQALSRTYQIPIHVIQRGPPTVVSHGGVNDTAGGSLTPQQSLAEGDRVVRISYHRRMYGLGEHYNSLQRVS